MDQSPNSTYRSSTPFGRLALLIAVEMDRVEAVELLVDAGADVGVLKPSGAHQVCENGLRSFAV